MTIRKTTTSLLSAALGTALCLSFAAPVTGQGRGLKAIRAADMKSYLEFLAAPEFEGRPAPSPEVNIAALYVAREAGRIGLKPLLHGGSYLQYFPAEVLSLAPEKSRLRLIAGDSLDIFDSPQSFCPGARSAAETGAVSGPLVFLGTVLSPPIDSWSGLHVPDVKGKIAVVIDAPLANPDRTLPGPGPLASARSQYLREKGAVGLVTIIRPDRETNLEKGGLAFGPASLRVVRFPDVETAFPEPASPAGAAAPSAAGPTSTFLWVDVRHAAGASILGVGRAELEEMFAAGAAGKAVPARVLDDRRLEISLYYDSRRSRTPNVVAWLEGSDASLNKEYVVISSHIDHLDPNEGHIYPGADDNGSATVAMLSLAKAFVAERPRRSLIFVWHTAEERGLIGAYYFVEHCPVPVEKISADLNMDMIARNDPGLIYLIGSNKLSKGLDAAIHAANDRSARMKLDYSYESPLHPDRFFFRSDQLPYIRYGIPGVWFFTGTHADYHQPTDVVARCDFAKMERVAKMVYLTAMDIGNRPGLLALDVNPAVTRRGPENMTYDWRIPPPEKSAGGK